MKQPHELTDDELASKYGSAQGNSLQRNQMEGESLRRHLQMRRDELKLISMTARIAMASFIVLGLCGIVSVIIDLYK